MKRKFVSWEDELHRELRKLKIAFILMLVVGSLLLITDIALLVMKSRH